MHTTRSQRRHRPVLSVLGVLVGLGSVGPSLVWASQMPTARIERLQREAESLVAEGHIGDAVAIYEKILESDPKFVPALKDLAWIRATSSDPQLRRPADAVRLAEVAFESLIVSFNSRPSHDAFPPNYDQVQIVQVGAAMAAAYASAGRFVPLASGPVPDLEEEVPAECSGEVLAATTVAVWGAEMASALEARAPSPQLAKLAQDMRELLASVRAQRPVEDGRLLPGTGAPAGQ